MKNGDRCIFLSVPVFRMNGGGKIQAVELKRGGWEERRRKGRKTMKRQMGTERKKHLSPLPLKLLDLRVGLLLNFNATQLRHGIKRLVN